MRVAIVSVVYVEPEWAATRSCIEAAAEYTRQHLAPTDVVYVDRKGYGSLARAYNRGFQQLPAGQYDWVWLVSNVTFAPDALEQLLGWFPTPDVAAINPVYESDHLHLRKQADAGFREVPFVEFTAPVVNARVFGAVPLDEAMPYWGHDLDWSHRAKAQGGRLLCCDGVELGHSYIRHAKKEGRMHPVTIRRLMERRRSDQPTRAALEKKYGKAWRNVLFWF